MTVSKPNILDRPVGGNANSNANSAPANANRSVAGNGAAAAAPAPEVDVRKLTVRMSIRSYRDNIFFFLRLYLMFIPCFEKEFI